MKTENQSPMNTETQIETLNTITMNTPNTEVDAVAANTNATTAENIPSESANPATDNTARLTELATKIRDALAKEQNAGCMVEDWQAKRLKAGIEMGECLIEAKSLKPVGGFIKWCANTFPKPCQRTLTRYMKIARVENRTRVSQAKGLRDAYKTLSSANAEVEHGTQPEVGSGAAVLPDSSPADSKLDEDLAKVRQHLSKAKDVLNGYPNIASCKTADGICDLVDALGDWVAKYRNETSGLNRVKDMDFQYPLNGEMQEPTPETDAEYTTAE